uniref:ABC transporter domain-containing protein n=2 Tax=Ditylum brightwellii TaxID=49249 RepID=A0A7S1ZEK8_9STRA|mmetsp:Transcript_30128/g.44814  ORF Transcript_30128/g.44814 Transcript_30128/m.44814 type:complete len:471 (+) Transcript_30128:246-1658(+)
MFKVNPPEEISTYANGASAQMTGPLSKEGYAVIDQVRTKSKKTPKTILSPMTVVFPEGCVTAIMGPSGSGKTTMLDTLTGSISSGVSVVGEVNLPGAQAYIPQDDLLHGFYTCQSYMEHYARLSGKNNNNSGTKEAIENILESLGLGEHRDTKVGDIFFKGLSGGQKRRLSIALEVLSNPNNVFLDEPTSGLDSESAFQVMKFLSEYVKAAPNRRVVLTIHQPSSYIWNLIDNIVLLTKSRLVYQGPRKEIETFFESTGYPTPDHYNPADHYVTAVNDEFSLHELSPEEWEKAFLQWSVSRGRQNSSMRRVSSGYIFQSTSQINTNRAGAYKATVELTKRYFLNLFFNPGVLGTRVAMYFMLSLLVGILFWDLGDLTTFSSIQSRVAVLFYCVAFFVFMSIAVLPFTVIERATVEKEVRNGYYHPAIYQVKYSQLYVRFFFGTGINSLFILYLFIPFFGGFWDQVVTSYR